MARRANKDISLELFKLGGFLIALIFALSILAGSALGRALFGIIIFPAILIAIVIAGFLTYRHSTREPMEEFEPTFARTTTFRRSPNLPGGTLIDQLRQVDWFQFEQLVALAYRKAGYRVERRGGANADGGIDLIVTNDAGERTAVQCKHWKAWKVNPKTIREFLGAMQILGINKGIFVTMSGYTTDAQAAATSQGVELLSETELARMLQADGGAIDAQISELLDGSKKLCPKCEADLILRTATKGPNAGGQFWGCSTFPKCRFTLPL